MDNVNYVHKCLLDVYSAIKLEIVLIVIFRIMLGLVIVCLVVICMGLVFIVIN